jgi:hypothetical protein
MTPHRATDPALALQYWQCHGNTDLLLEAPLHKRTLYLFVFFTHISFVNTLLRTMAVILLFALFYERRFFV